MTNADYIREMNNEQLAKILHDHACMLCPIEDCSGRMIVGREECQKHWLDWLKQEVPDNGKD